MFLNCTAIVCVPAAYHGRNILCSENLKDFHLTCLALCLFTYRLLCRGTLASDQLRLVLGSDGTNWDALVAQNFSFCRSRLFYGHDPQ